MLSTHQLLAKNPEPSEKEIRKAIAGNTCRCTGYMNIFKAIQLAGQNMKGSLKWRSSFPASSRSRNNPEEVYDFLTDPNRFAPLLPDFQSLTVQDATHFTVKVNVGISYIKGSADVKMELAEADRPRRAQYKGQGAWPAEMSTLVAGFDLAPVEPTCGDQSRTGREKRRFSAAWLRSPEACWNHSARNRFRN